MNGADKGDMPAIRQCEAEVFYTTRRYKDMRDRYGVAVAPETIGGVYTEVFTPTQGIAPRNEERVLINVHGGGFDGGARTLSHLESIPIASVGKIKVISIDYRLGPEYTFPAASEDVAAVYRELLSVYKPKNIGLYGCSAGGALTAQAIAWFQKEHLPLPGAVGMFCMGAPRARDAGEGEWWRGDAGAIVGALSGVQYQRFKPLSYYRGVNRNNPLASPGDSDGIMAKFPPSLLISVLRDFALSSVLVTHAQMVRLGVKADLHIWEGMEHGFHVSHPAFPESREAYEVIVKFFDTHLGESPSYAPVAPFSERQVPLEPYEDSIPGTLVTFEMIPVPGGTVEVPGPAGGRTVEVEAVWIGQTEVTWDAYDVFALGLDEPGSGAADAEADAIARPSPPYGAPDYGWGHQGYPVMSVTRDAAEAFCEWLSAKTGRKYRLPTEAEWLRAAALATPEGAASPERLESIAWHAGNAEGETHAVAARGADALGLYDLFGNVAEWVTTEDDARVMRGGSFRDPVSAIADSARAVQNHTWNERDPQLPKSIWWLSDAPFAGFRIVREP